MLKALDLISDDELILQIRQDNREAFSSIYKRYWKELYNDAYHRTRNREKAEDIVQNVFADLWLKPDKQQIANLGVYLHTAVKFQFYKSVSRQKGPSAYLDYLDVLLYSSANADDLVREKEIAKVIELWLQALPERRRKIFLMRYAQDMSTNEIAKKLGISRNTVQAQLHTASQSLTVRLAQFLTVMVVIQTCLK
ncbi:MAG TPA: sigma-70 family RNA polymerase sigma factor [Puia sp.]|nr:sigma-70 family RNA polymerase sigma factor [Puia sp.]